ncbi:DUF3626 domain-containing protein [Alkalicaulis satelles]|uniref:DUF3626 domain-containing protein n=2 Tax=Alkalicaulis satelles TaxID=2609175 RepID=A0A5M6Z8X2_9PROT|nr:DUF3626 domain-containing protein [Alkalicaulis satelles]
MSVTLNFHPDWAYEGESVLARIASEGVYRSQFETGTSNGGLTAFQGGARWMWESRIFSGAYDSAPAPLRPKYGALNDRGSPYGGSPRFGSAHFRVRAEVLERTTFCFPDSYLDPVDFGVAERMALIELKAAQLDNLEPLDRYIEAHVHGPLEIGASMDALVLDPSYRGTQIEAFANALACPVEWHPGFRLPVDRYEDCAAYRGREVADLIPAVAENGCITPRLIGQAQNRGVGSPLLLKRLWHCLAHFGAQGGL